jgi:hypothetical protein
MWVGGWVWVCVSVAGRWGPWGVCCNSANLWGPCWKEGLVCWVGDRGLVIVCISHVHRLQCLGAVPHHLVSTPGHGLTLPAAPDVVLAVMCGRLLRGPADAGAASMVAATHAAP